MYHCIYRVELMGWRDNSFHIKEVDTVSLLTPAQMKQLIHEDRRGRTGGPESGVCGDAASHARKRTGPPHGLREVYDG